MIKVGKPKRTAEDKDTKDEKGEARERSQARPAPAEGIFSGSATGTPTPERDAPNDFTRVRFDARPLDLKIGAEHSPFGVQERFVARRQRPVGLDTGPQHAFPALAAI